MNRLFRIRQEIQKIDRDIILLLRRRFFLISQVSRIKRKNRIATGHPEYEDFLIKKNTSCLHQKLRKFILPVYKSIFDSSRKSQKKD
ncbi:MAG: chorismate mutase [Candidatus Muiribacteriaceae bacterium]